ncbi:MAG: hypothetical protein QM698_01395 [Micropepsaceae bacterium]
MNPELLRNIWIELTERRLTLMIIIVACILVVAISPGDWTSASHTAELVFYAVVVLWGTRCAAQSVVEEIANKTWDGQRLSAIRPWTMVWGKLAGSTVLAWIGGLLCLTVILYQAYRVGGADNLGMQAGYFFAIGIISQATALLASVVAVRRRMSHTRFDVFLYQLAGLIAALLVWRVWQTVDPTSLFRSLSGGIDPFAVRAIWWWGGSFDPGTFYLASLAAFLFWVILGNYRVMRRELQVQNGPVVWLAFLVFAAAYAGGFDFWRDYIRDGAFMTGMRAVQGGIALVIITYMMALVEPKEIVAYRWLIECFKTRQFVSLLARFPAWGYAYLAVVILGVLAIVLLPWSVAERANVYGGPMIVLAALGFVLRDCAVFMAMGLGQVGKRSDIAALAILALLYGFIPGMFAQVEGATAFFYPSEHDPSWLNPLAAWAQALIGWFLILRRPDLRLRPQS